MKVNKYTLDINNMRKFLFSRLVTQLFLVCVVGCLFLNIADVEPSLPQKSFVCLRTYAGCSFVA